ncbi:XRE family transcriptional regulator [Pseudomonas sp. 28 E 9]|uniref:XRE family transcriptional regulator n=1 Tax=Pseudomonas sp. 28 E 9 TaxID=1844098 RepID=UPI003531E53E
MFDEKDSWADFCSSQLILIKKLLISPGVGERLREERERLGKNQTDFGVSAGVSRGTQKAYELGASSPDIRYLSGLQELGVDVYYVLTGSQAEANLNNLTEVESAVLENLRRMPEGDRNVLLRTAAAFASAAGLEGNKKPD